MLKVGKRKVQIVQISSVHKAFDTRIFYKISKSLVKAGYSVDLIIQHDKDEVIDGINVKSLPKAKRKLDRILSVIPRLFVKCISYPRNTLFHFHDPELLPLGLFLKMVGYKVIYDVHEDVPKDLITKEWLPKNTRKILSSFVDFLERKISSKLDGIITVVPAISNRFKNLGIVEVRNYPIIDSFEADQKYGKEKYLIYVGSLTYRRGLPEMVKAIGKVKTKDISFYIGGKFDDNGLKEELSQIDGWNKVRHLGWIEKKEILAIMSGAIAGLLTLREIPSHLESLPVKMFEYMLSGIPVIASDFAFWRPFILENNCGLVVDQTKAEEISDAIEWLIENPKEAKKMGANGRKAVLEKYNWKSEEKKLVSLYASLTI